MAYTLRDPFRALRIMLRLNGIVLGLLLGFTLLATPAALLLKWGLHTGGPLWPLRLAGAALIALGLFFILTANQEYISSFLLIATMIANGLFALVLLVAYFQQELNTLSLTGRILLVIIFLFCLIGGVTPLRFLRFERNY